MGGDGFTDPSEAFVPPEHPFPDVEEPDDGNDRGGEGGSPPSERSEDGEQQ